MSDTYTDESGNIFDIETGALMSRPLKVTITPSEEEDDEDKRLLLPETYERPSSSTPLYEEEPSDSELEQLQEMKLLLQPDSEIDPSADFTDIILERQKTDLTPLLSDDTAQDIFQEEQAMLEQSSVPPPAKEPIAPTGYVVKTLGEFSDEELQELDLGFGQEELSVPLSDALEDEDEYKPIRNRDDFREFVKKQDILRNSLIDRYEASTDSTEKAKLVDHLNNLSTYAVREYERFLQSPANPDIRYLVPNEEVIKKGENRAWVRISEDDERITVMKLVDKEQHMLEDDTMFNRVAEYWQSGRYDFSGVEPFIDRYLPDRGSPIGIFNRFIFRPIAQGTVELAEYGFDVVDAAIYGMQDVVEETVQALGGTHKESISYGDFPREFIYVMWEFSESYPAAAGLRPILRPVAYTQKIAQQRNLKRLIKENARIMARENKILDAQKIYLETGTVRARLAETAARVAEENNDLALDVAREMQISLGVSNLIKRSRIKTGTASDGTPIYKTDADGAYIYNERVDYDAISEAGQKELDRLRAKIDEDAAARGGKTAPTTVDDLVSSADETQQSILRTALNVDMLKKYVAIAADLRQTHPIPKNKKVSEWLMETMANAENLDDPVLADLLSSVNKYGVDFPSFAAMVYSNYSSAGKTLQTISRLRKMPTEADEQYAAMKALYADESAFLKGVRRLENIRRGAMVSAIKTASRNLQSGLVRGGFEGLTNIWESAIKEIGMGNWRQARRELTPFTYDKRNPVRFKISEEWSRSFGQMRWLLNRLEDPADVQRTTELMLGQSPFKTLHEKFYRNYNEIQQIIDVPPATTSVGKAANMLLDEGEDLVWTLNAPNRWQEFVLRESHFMSEIIRLTRQEWKTDLVEGLMTGKLDDFINDAAHLRGDSKFRFYDLMEQATTKALRATYAAEPQTKMGRDLNNFVTRWGFTLAIPFPRFMITSMELIGNMVAGAPIAGMRMALGPRKFMGETGLGDRAIARQISQNISGMLALTMAWQFRNSEFAGAKYDEAQVGESKINLGPIYYLPQMLMIAEFTKALAEGRPIPITKQDALRTLTGSGFRPGQTIDAVTSTLLTALQDDSLDWDNAGPLAVGTFIGEIGASYLQPLTMAVDLSRAIQSDPDLAYKDWTPDPNYTKWDAFNAGFSRPFQVKGFGWYDQKAIKETLAAVIKELDYADRTDLDKFNELTRQRNDLRSKEIHDRVSASREEAAKRGSPLLNFLGVGTSERDTPEQFFLKQLRLDDYIIGGKTGVGKLDRAIDGYLHEVVPDLVRGVMKLDLTERQKKALLQGQIAELRSEITASTLPSMPRVQAWHRFSRHSRAVRDAAVEAFEDKYERKLNKGDNEDLYILNEIADEWSSISTK